MFFLPSGSGRRRLNRVHFNNQTFMLIDFQICHFFSCRWRFKNFKLLINY